MNSVTTQELAGQSLFADLTSAQLGRLAPTARNVSFPAGHRPFEEGGTADRFWIIQEGSVALDLHLPDRGAVIIETFGPGAVLGWSWLFPPYRWRFGAEATRGVRAIEFDGRLLRGIWAPDPLMAHELTRRFAEIVVERLQATRMRLLDMYAGTGEQR